MCTTMPTRRYIKEKQNETYFFFAILFGFGA